MTLKCYRLTAWKQFLSLVWNTCNLIEFVCEEMRNIFVPCSCRRPRIFPSLRGQPNGEGRGGGRLGKRFPSPPPMLRIPHGGWRGRRSRWKTFGWACQEQPRNKNNLLFKDQRWRIAYSISSKSSNKDSSSSIKLNTPNFKNLSHFFAKWTKWLCFHSFLPVARSRRTAPGPPLD